MNETDDYDPEEAELRAQARAERRYRAKLSAHPHCFDPDHPGCSNCQENYGNEDAETDD